VVLLEQVQKPAENAGPLLFVDVPLARRPERDGLVRVATKDGVGALVEHDEKIEEIVLHFFLLKMEESAPRSAESHEDF